jgi:hypothetical protein
MFANIITFSKLRFLVVSLFRLNTVSANGIPKEKL